MDVLLSKQSFKTNTSCKDTVRYLKRKDDIQRRKQAREISVQDKRKIPENLEISNDSVLVSKSPCVKNTNKTKKSRLDLLKEWRETKDRQKAASKPKKATFVVKHVEHKDGLFSKNKKTNKPMCKDNNIEGKKYGSSINKLKPKVLQERNMNIIHEASIPRQSYLDWKRTQIQKEPLVGRKKRLPQSNAKHTEKKADNNTNKTQSAITKNNTGKSDRVTRSMKSKPHAQNKVLRNAKTDLPNTACGKNMPNGVISNSERVEDIVKETKENTEQETEKAHDTTYEIESEALTDVPTSFEAPVGLAFTNFEFDVPAVSSSNTISDLTVANNKAPIEEQEVGKQEVFVNNDGNKTPKCHRRMDSLSKKNSFDTPKTPVSLFKEKHNITPCTTPKNSSIKRTSLTPNPKNFLSKMEDPVAQRIESASKTAPHTPPDVSASAKHFSNLVASEEEKFVINIEKWDKILADGSVPEDEQGNVLSAIGQAQLLIRKRFKQFKELIELHKDKTAEKAAHASDLDGFWEMINFQVDDVHKRFAELEQLKANGWEVKQQPIVKAVKKVKTKVTTKKPAQKNVSAKSDFKKFREQMKAKQLAAAEPNSQSFISILAPAKTENKTMTPVRRSLRNLNIAPKNSPGICMLVPLDAVEPLPNPLVDEFSADSLEEPSPDKKVTSVAKKQPQPSDQVKLRRSTRKTPSKYRSVDVTHDMNSKNVACNLFGDDTCTEVNEDENFDFSKYLSKTIISEDGQAKNDLLSSFVEPAVKEVVVEQDLMMFSPIVEKTKGFVKKK